jgi:hypothetical protein
MTAAKKKKSKRRPASKKKSVARKARRPAPVSIGDAPRTRQTRAFNAIRKALKDHGLTDTIAEVTFAGPPPPQGCPPGQVSRIVCFKKPDGTVVCESRCQPI